MKSNRIREALEWRQTASALAVQEAAAQAKMAAEEAAAQAKVAAEAAERQRERARECDSFLFAQSEKLLEAQAKALDELRGRAGTLLAATSLATAFLGKTILDRYPASGDVSRALSWIAMAAFLACISGILFILWPRTNAWTFTLGLQILAEDWMGEEGPLYRELALKREEHHTRNEVLMTKLFRAFAVSCGALGIEILLWLAALAVLPTAAQAQGTVPVPTPAAQTQRLSLQQKESVMGENSGQSDSGGFVTPPPSASPPSDTSTQTPATTPTSAPVESSRPQRDPGKYRTSSRGPGERKGGYR